MPRSWSLLVYSAETNDDDDLFFFINNFPLLLFADATARLDDEAKKNYSDELFNSMLLKQLIRRY